MDTGATPPRLVDIPARISFYYPIEDIFNDASMRSMYQVRNLKDATGVSLTDDYAITEDERGIWLSLLQDAVFDVFLTFLKYNKAIPDSIAFNADFETNVSLEMGVFQTVVACSVSIVDNADYNENYLQVVDVNLLKTIRFYTLRDWFESQGRSEDAQKFNALYIMALRNVMKYAFQLKKSSM